MDLGLTGHRVLITGASQGIGAGAAEAFAEEGCDLHLTARNGEALEALAKRLRKQHGVSVRCQALDLTEPGSVEAVIEEAGHVDVLLNNAGVIPGGNLDELNPRSWRDGWELKVFGYVDMTRAVYARMRERGHGVILNNIGNAGEKLDPDYVAGTTGNAALMAFTKAIGGRSLDDGIRVVGINPGPVDTDRIYKLLRHRAAEWLGDENRWEELQARYPLGRPASVREVVDTMVFLASPRCSYTSGTIVTIDGGICSRNSII